MSSIKSFLEVEDGNDNFLFTQIKLLDGTTLRVKETVDQIHTILTGTDEDAVGVLTIWLEEDGSIPQDVVGLFA
ncbi:hypothetical protein K7A41_01510 [Sphingobacterium sp. InxBP1]|uniref:hypothetical protein n=1 Tax=Sphingobacterium sp. InxBP1 TaxID=2870328 RepID=UPI0022433531|nr:hypothetical protein [Sphingobacterium sp. InxBP1]MCW8309893.1 hypothetical protein [Sphingobacterium sp. InxBP1]